MGKWENGIGNNRLLVVELISHDDKGYNTVNTFDGIITALYGDRW